MEITGNLESVVSSMPLIGEPIQMNEAQQQIRSNLATIKPIDKKTVTNTITKLSLVLPKIEVKKTFLFLMINP